MENAIKPVTHSRVAGRILFKLIWAKLKHSPSIYQVFTPIAQRNPVNGKGTTFMFTVKQKSELTKDIWRVVFENKQLSIKKFYKGLNLAGRGFIISSPRNQVSRYYTTCNCMGVKIYEEYRTAFLACINHKPYTRKYKSVEEHYRDEDNTLELVIKFYKETQTGITRQIDDASGSDEFYIDGPHGKGFNFTPENSDGTHVIFMGGTGALPFMDLFAYLGRKILKENSPDYSIFPDEKFTDLHPNAKFVVYGYFPTRDRSVGLEFCEMIDALHKIFKSNAFQFNPVFTREGGGRLTEQKIDEILTSIYLNSIIKRLLVCGPPPQNNMFQQ